MSDNSLADRVGVVVGEVGDALAAAEDLVADVRLAVAVPPFTALAQGHLRLLCRSIAWPYQALDHFLADPVPLGRQGPHPMWAWLKVRGP